MSYPELSYLALQPVAHLAAREEAQRLARKRDENRRLARAWGRRR